MKRLIFILPTVIILALATLLIPRPEKAEAQSGGIVLTDITSSTGITAQIAAWKASYTGGAWWPWGVMAFDYDNDGDLDLVVQNHAVGPASHIFKNSFAQNGNTTFTSANVELGLPFGAALAGTYKPTAWDFNGNGYLDLAFTDAYTNTCFFNNAGTGFTAMGFAMDDKKLTEVGDFDSNGYPDGGGYTKRYTYDPNTSKFVKNNYIHPLTANPPPCIAAFLAAQFAKNPPNLAIDWYVVNLNNDQYPDLVCSGFNSYGQPFLVFSRYLIGGPNGYTDATQSLGLPWANGDPVNGAVIYAGDFNKDGKTDFIVLGYGLYLSGPTGYTFKSGALSTFVTSVGVYSHVVYPVDLDNDGDFDLVICKPRDSITKIYEQTSPGTFAEIKTIGSWDGDPVWICDFNNDGFMDVLVGAGGSGSETVLCYQNNSEKKFRYIKVQPQMNAPNPFAVGTKVEIFAPGTLGGTPLLTDYAHADGTALNFGVARNRMVDVRVSFPGGSVKNLTSVLTNQKITVSP